MYKRYLFFTIIALLLIAGCKKDGNTGPLVGKDNAAFTSYENSFLEGYWKLNPDLATGAGYHKYDSVLLAPTDDYRQKLVNFAKLQIDSMARFEVNSFTDENRMDYRILQNQLEYMQWQITQLKAYQWNPNSYNVTETFATILNEHYAPLPKRLKNFYEKMAGIPAFYKEAERQIKNPVSELVNLTVDEISGSLDIFEKDFADSLKKTSIAETERKAMMDRAHTTAETLKQFTEWLKALKSDHPRSFRLGKDLYEDKFKYEIQSDLPAQKIFNAAVDRKRQLHKSMLKLSKQLWPKYFGKAAMPTDSLELIAKVIDTLSVKHSTPGEYQHTIEQLIPKLTAFVKTKDLISLDPSKPLVIRKEPAYIAGVADASMSAPGPYDKEGNSYFNVGSLNGWTASKAESYLREYNQYILQILCIHEAIPGHYAQLVYANKAPSLIKSIFGNGAMVEGWAVYSEEMMLDNGYENDTPEIRLMWYKWHLRSVCNTILDYSVHVQNMSKEDAIKLLTHEAFQQKAEAESKWIRVAVSSVQLDSYYTGYKEIYDLREAYKQKIGEKYTLKGFNEKFLSYGNAPVKLIKEAMIGKN